MEENNYEKNIIKAKAKARLMFFISAGILLIAVIFILASYFYYYQATQLKGASKTLNAFKNLSIKFSQIQKKANQQTEESQNFVRRKIDGVLVKPGKQNFYPIAIMLDNHPDARPQFGLSRANLVFEAPVEGVTTRFMAIYAAGQDIDKIGPIRSARPYFIDWAEEFSAVYAHCGGSPAALAKIIKNNIKDLNEYYNGGYFWRTDLRQRPHNLLTSSKKLKDYLEKKNYQAGAYLAWKFKSDNPPAGDTGTAAVANIIIKNYGVVWKYNLTDNNYIRYFNGKKYLDAEGAKIKAKNIILMVVPAKVIDAELRLKMADIGTGQAVVCLDGFCQEGTWRKKSQSARTRFFNKDKKEFEFNAGPTWIEVVRPEYEIEY